MNTKFEKYLDMVDKLLKPLPTLDRIDIVKEIKGSIVEMENENFTTEQILERLGSAKDLAKAYLGDLLANGTGFSWKRLLTVYAFYSVVSFSGLFIIPTLAIIAPVFIFCAILTPLLGAVKLIDYLLNLSIPYVEYIGFKFGSTILSPVPVFFISIFMGVILYFVGRGTWKLLIIYCRKISNTKRDLSI